MDNFDDKKNQLIYLIKNYLNRKTTTEELQKFAWNTIDTFRLSSKNSKQSPYKDTESEFWYAIWQIQHIADEEHEIDGTTFRELTKALNYLQRKEKMPSNCQGIRP